MRPNPDLVQAFWRRKEDNQTRRGIFFSELFSSLAISPVFKGTFLGSSSATFVTKSRKQEEEEEEEEEEEGGVVSYVCAAVGLAYTHPHPHTAAFTTSKKGRKKKNANVFPNLPFLDVVGKRGGGTTTKEFLRCGALTGCQTKVEGGGWR